MAALMHDALFYGSDEEFTAAMTPFLRDGVAAGHATVAAVTAANIELLSDALGDDAKAVTLIDRDDWYRRPAATIAGWQRLLDEAKTHGRQHIRIAGEVAFGADGDSHATWTRYESVLNEVFAHAAAWIVCPYDTRRLPETVVRDARRTHPAAFTLAGPVRHTEAYTSPAELLRDLREPLPPVSGTPLLELPLTGDESLVGARQAVTEVVTGGGWSGGRLDEALIVLNEVVGNSLQHGRGRRVLRVWLHDGALVCEVTDEGPGIADPLAGYRPPGTLPSRGCGLWVANQLSDRLAVAHDGGVTRVRFLFR